MQSHYPRALLLRWLVVALSLTFPGPGHAVLPLERHSGRRQASRETADAPLFPTAGPFRNSNNGSIWGNPTEVFSGVNLRLPPDVIAMVSPPPAGTLIGTDLLSAPDPSGFRCPAGDLARSGIPLTTFYFELSTP